MAVFTETKNINVNIFSKSLPEFDGHARNKAERFGIVAIHMEHRALCDLGYIGAVGARSGVTVIGRKSNLVIDHKMDRASHPVSFEKSHLRDLIHHALSRYGRIAMYYNRANLFVIALLLG